MRIIEWFLEEIGSGILWRGIRFVGGKLKSLKIPRRVLTILCFVVFVIVIFLLKNIPITSSSPAQSQLNNLHVWQDDTDVRTIHMQWEDLPKLEYVININRLDSSGQITDIDVSSERVSSTQTSFQKALPRTSYSILVYEPISGKQLSKNITITKAPDYIRFAADCHGGTMYWVERADLAQGQDVLDDDTKRKEYSQISVSKFADMLVEYDFYGISDFTYREASSHHQFEVLYILRGPDGKVVSIEEQSQLASAAPNHRWKWKYSLKPLIQKMTGTNSLILAGDYMYEVYFDGYRVSREQFTLTD